MDGEWICTDDPARRIFWGVYRKRVLDPRIDLLDPNDRPAKIEHQFHRLRFAESFPGDPVQINFAPFPHRHT